MISRKSVPFLVSNVCAPRCRCGRRPLGPCSPERPGHIPGCVQSDECSSPAAPGGPSVLLPPGEPGSAVGASPGLGHTRPHSPRLGAAWDREPSPRELGPRTPTTQPLALGSARPPCPLCLLSSPSGTGGDHLAPPPVSPGRRPPGGPVAPPQGGAGVGTLSPPSFHPSTPTAGCSSGCGCPSAAVRLPLPPRSRVTCPPQKPSWF